MPRSPLRPPRWQVTRSTSALAAGEEHFTLKGRPAFKRKTLDLLKIQKVATGISDHRRHILHWDLHLKKMITDITNGLLKTYKTDQDFSAFLSRKMKAAGIENIRSATPEGLVKRLSEELNSAPGNLVVDNGAINMAIEKVRINLRQYREHLEHSDKFLEDVSPGTATDANVGKYIQQADAFFGPAQGTEDPSIAITAINNEVLLLLQSCKSTNDIWTTVHDLDFSVTFDLSSRAKRDKTERAMSIQRAVTNCIASANYEHALETLLGLLNPNPNT